MQNEAERDKAKVTDVDGLKRSIYEVQRELLQERTKVKALSEELEKPTNKQRWRKLGGHDPAVFEMIQKVQCVLLLTRAVLRKAEADWGCVIR